MDSISIVMMGVADPLFRWGRRNCPLSTSRWLRRRHLKGAKPADLPVEQATKFEFLVNMSAAKQIGLTIPANVCWQERTGF